MLRLVARPKGMPRWRVLGVDPNSSFVYKAQQQQKVSVLAKIHVTPFLGPATKRHILSMAVVSRVLLPQNMAAIVCWASSQVSVGNEGLVSKVPRDSVHPQRWSGQAPLNKNTCGELLSTGGTFHMPLGKNKQWKLQICHES